MTKTQQTNNLPLAPEHDGMPAPPADSIAYEEQEAQADGVYTEGETSTALVPAETRAIEIVDTKSNFALAKQRRIMKTSYTGAKSISIDDLDQRQGLRMMHILGAHIEPVEQRVDEKTGEVIPGFNQVLFKLSDGQVVSCGGVMAENFARDMIEDLGEYDWPEPVLVIVHMHQGKKFAYPKFQAVEDVNL